jgi:hypothetical protein
VYSGKYMCFRVFVHTFQRVHLGVHQVLRVASSRARPRYIYKILCVHGIRSASSGMSTRYLRVEYPVLFVLLRDEAVRI